MLHTKLIAVGLADGAGLIRPGVPDVGGEVADVVGLFLPDPEELIHRAFQIRAAQREDGKLLLQIVAVDKAEFFDRVGGGAVLPMGADGEVVIAHAVIEDIEAVGTEDLIGVAHGGPPYFVWQPAARMAASASSSVGATLG